MTNNLSPKQIEMIKGFQKSEISEYHIYTKLSKVIKDPENAKILERIGNEEKNHYEIWKSYTNEEVKPNMFKVRWYCFISRVFGLTFGIKLMEGGENKAQKTYNSMLADIPEAKRIMDEEHIHEKELIGMIDEELLQYAGSIVLGLNDALVELTGALAGLSLALQNTKLIAMAGLITGIAASFSMAASDYLSKKADNTEKEPLRSATYTGIAYIITVTLLILPYLIFHHYLLCLGLTLFTAILIIFGFNYYISVAKDLNFKRRFTEMALISLGVSALTFGIGFLVRNALGIDI
ncbi:MAG: VIT1/CCC1 transporter family protein [Bacteroidales bacterium]|nr:VIT1/CCC1 transporter family protein [Bacteroidales bacterium]